MLLIPLTMPRAIQVTVRCDCVTVIQHEQQRNPESKAAQWNSAIVHRLHMCFTNCDVEMSINVFMFLLD